jgi:capsular polysaccharide transport system ATP-binding protein
MAEKLPIYKILPNWAHPLMSPFAYSSGMKSRLQFGLLWHLILMCIYRMRQSAGDASFKKKASDAFQANCGSFWLIMVSHSDGTLRQFCQAGIWLHEGQAHWFDDIEDALKKNKDSISK